MKPKIIVKTDANKKLTLRDRKTQSMFNMLTTQEH